MMEDKYCELNQDFYDLKVTLLNDYHNPFHENYKISKTVMRYLIHHLNRFINSNYDCDIFIYDEDIIDLEFDNRLSSNDIRRFEIGTNLIDNHEEFIPAENYNPVIPHIVNLINSSREEWTIKCAIKKSEEYIEQEKEWDRVSHFIKNGTLRGYREMRRPTVTWFKDENKGDGK